MQPNAKFDTTAVLFLVVLLEGFVTISAEILTIRQLIPFVGSSVVVTSLIIGVFLLFLAYGYRRGGQITENHLPRLARNFVFSALWMGLGLSYFFLAFWFSWFYRWLPNYDLIPLSAYLLLITAPLVYVLGQTVPLTLHAFPGAEGMKTGALGGRVLHINTLGSFLGAVLTSVVLFSLLGVAWTVVINVLVLTILALVLTKKESLFIRYGVFVSMILPAVYVVNVMVEQNYFLKTNHYANYRVRTFLTADNVIKEFNINNSFSSMLDSEGHGFPYVEMVKNILFKDLGFRNKDILILGAGGFTLSKTAQTSNHFVYVDIDPSIKSLSEAHFSGEVVGDFVAQDARRYLQTTTQQFDAVVVDAYSSPRMLPAHLATLEYFQSIAEVLKPEGVVIINLIASNDFKDAYSMRMDNTIRQALGFCTNQPLFYPRGVTNMLYVCYPQKPDWKVYTDNLNNATLDAFEMKQAGASL